MSAPPRQDEDEPKLVNPVDGAFILLAGFPDPPSDEEIYEAAAESGRARPSIERKNSLSEAETFLGQLQVGAAAFGPEVDPVAAGELLQSFDNPLFRRPLAILVGPFDDVLLLSLLQADHLFYYSPTPLPRPETARLLVAGLTHFQESFVLDLAALGRSRSPRATMRRTLLTVGETMLQTRDLEALEDPVLTALDELVDIEDGRLWIYDELRHVLRASSSADFEVSAVAGLTSFAARTGRTLRTENAAADPRYDFEADGGTEQGGDAARLMATPILGPERRVLGVLSLRRPASDAAFTADEADRVEVLAQHLAPQIALRNAHLLSSVQEGLESARNEDLFRSEAVEANARGFVDTGRILKNGPGWTRWTWRLLLSGFVAAFLFLVFGTMSEYAGGPAVVRIGQRVDVASQAAASVIEVEVEPGTQVDRGAPLVRLYGAAEASEIANLEQEFEQLLRRRLAAPGDTDVETSLINARTNLERARARLDERVARAPSAGIVGDVRIRPGQHVAAGSFLLSIIADEEMRSVVGFVPGHFGPQIRAGGSLRLTLAGYPDLSFDLEVTSIGEEVVSAREARQALGGAVADSVDVQGSVVVVEARLNEASFEAEGQSWAFRDGMLGTMEVRVRRRPILLHLVPGLERAVRRWND